METNTFPFVFGDSAILITVQKNVKLKANIARKR